MATTPIKRGDDEPQLQYRSESYQSGSGSTVVESWRGISVPKMRAKFGTVVFTTTSAEIKDQFDVSELTPRPITQRYYPIRTQRALVLTSSTSQRSKSRSPPTAPRYKDSFNGLNANGSYGTPFSVCA